MPPSRLLNAFRRWGYLQADLDPLGRLPPFVHADLRAASGPEAARLRSIYCGAIGAEFMHLPEAERCRWIAGRMESEVPAPDRRRILRRLAATELFERFMHQRFVGTKRYSLEGAAGLVPLLDAVLEGAAAQGAGIVLLSMSHRGRLAVMVQIVGIAAALVFADFEDVDPRSVLGGGDVRYHLGATGEFRAASGDSLQLHLVSNPSHLEAVGPVMMGRARARQARLGEEGTRRVLPVSLHGDAALAGQGIASETLNLSELPGFSVGGTIHVVIDNLIGFTTPRPLLHTGRFASDAARRLDVPIFHVNGQDPEAAARAGAMALEYRAAFHTDVVVDLICYRRYGHSEVDDPTTTQPQLYEKIATLPMLWQAYADRLEVAPPERAGLEEEIRAELERALQEGRAMTTRSTFRQLPDYWSPFAGGRYERGFEVETAVSAQRLAEIGRKIASAPDGFSVHPKVQKGLQERLAMSRGKRRVDWGMAEALAFGALLEEGIPVRLSGQDSRRGTFNQRHAVLFDTRDGTEHVPLARLRPGQGRFEIIDSPLSEASVLGFEYGYSRDTPEALVCWEAQFGDFANGAQVILDQFVAAGEDKWGLLSGLVLLLPHGYEGQGAEHSSARLERFLALAAEDNLQVVQPTTAAQYFHVLRRQCLRRWRKPLVVLTPKSLLRAPAAASALEELAAGAFRPVLGDPESAGAERVLICTGRIAHDLLAERARRAERVALLRLEQIYPFPQAELLEELARRPEARRIVWVQEEPGNMGALRFIRPYLQRLAGDRPVTVVHRAESASPATGSLKAHTLEQKALLDLAFATQPPPERAPR
ncbi:MAG TPA: 2-oxoglutarate dehydrogenase E1 component [Candidatus Polarisedimenticolia bacterium]|jgi:2-oxoglutarate dehydrogenase E1 component|nr:2-oxoglutarate dehydrogenase E1 component [Candidatus Polarisedimenticolia bacterium]